MPDFRERVMAARQEELEAYEMYSEMAAIAPTREMTLLIQSIAHDELGHSRILAAMLEMEDESEIYTARAQGRRRMPDRERFRRMVASSIEDELNAVSEYAQLAIMAPELEQRLLFLTLVADEFGHARTFIAILNSSSEY